MRSLAIAVGAVCAALAWYAPSVWRSPARPVLRAAWALGFEPNRGQVDSHAQFVARGAGYSWALAGGTATLTLRDDAFRLSLAGANPDAHPEALEERAAKVNYFIGNDPSRWLVGVPTYGKVRYGSVYPGIDVVFYGDQHQLEYDLIVRPGADPRTIALRIEGAERLGVDPAGDLLVTLARTHTQARQKRPTIYQESNGVRRSIEGGYTLSGNDLTFWLGPYDPNVALTIDPVVVYSGAFGGSGPSNARAIAVDARGNTYVTGNTTASDFPIGGDAVQRQLVNGEDAFVAKVDASGANLVYATYLGGNNYRRDYEATSETAWAIAVDFAGNVSVTGTTQSTDFPTVNAYQSQPQYNVGKGYDGFVAKLNASGSALLFSTYLGGRDGATSARSVAVDAIGNTYAGGQTGASQFPATTVIGPPGTRGEGFITKFNAAGGVVYATRLPATILTIAVDGAGQPHVAGYIESQDFPIVNGWLTKCPTRSGLCIAGFLAKLSASGSQIVYSTYLGGDIRSGYSSTGAVATAVAVDSVGNAYVAGVIGSTEFPTVKPQQPTYGGGYSDAFVASFGPNGAVRYATYLGGGGTDSATMAADVAGNVYVTGSTDSTDFPLAVPLIGVHPGGPVFRSADGGSQWSPAAHGLSSYVKAIALDPKTPTTMYAAARSGVYKTTDAGATWRLSSDGLPRDGSVALEVNAIAIDPVTPTTLYINTAPGTFKSVDAGGRWELVDAIQGAYIATIVIDPGDPATVYMGGYAGNFRKTVDGGRTWADVDTGLPRRRFQVIWALAVDPVTRGTLYSALGMEDGSGTAFVYKSTDGGASWTRANAFPSLVTRLAVDPSNPRTLYAGSPRGLFKSTDAGASATKISDIPVFAIAIAANQGPIYVSTVGDSSLSTRCVQRSLDGGLTWEAGGSVYRGASSCSLPGLAINPFKPTLVFAGGSIPPVPYLTRLAPDGSLRYSTYLAAHQVSGVAADAEGNAYLVGQTASGSPIGITKIAPLRSPPLASPPPFPRAIEIRRPGGTQP